jgi:hypothetical protein
MRSIEQLLIEHNSEQEANEAIYVSHRERLGQALSKVLAIRGLLDSFELKINKALVELETELKTVENNFNK